MPTLTFFPVLQHAQGSLQPRLLRPPATWYVPAVYILDVCRLRVPAMQHAGRLDLTKEVAGLSMHGCWW